MATKTAKAPAAPFIAGKTTEEVVRLYVKAQQDLNLPVHPWMLELVARFDRKAAARAERAA